MMQNVGGGILLVPLGAQVMNLKGLVTLNDTGACVWKMLVEERSLDELTAAVSEHFDVASETARDDVQAFVDEIARLGLLEP